MILRDRPASEYKERNCPHILAEELTDKATAEAVFLRGNIGHSEYLDTPGAMIKALSRTDREACKKLTSEHFQGRINA